MPSDAEEPPSNKNNSFLSNIQKMLKAFKKSKDNISPSQAIYLNENPYKADLLSNKIVADIMIPRSDVIAVNAKILLDDLNQAFLSSSHTRILVYDDNLDNVIGFVHIKDIFEVIVNKKNYNLRNHLRKPIIATGSMKLITLLTEMRRKRTHIAIVVDEYGGNDGIVTIEDIIEEIVGRIEDEHDEEQVSDSYSRLEDKTIELSARMEITQLEELINIKLSDHHEAQTIGGLVLSMIGYVPIPGTIIKINDKIELEVIAASARTLTTVKITVNE